MTKAPPNTKPRVSVDVEDVEALVEHLHSFERSLVASAKFIEKQRMNLTETLEDFGMLEKRSTKATNYYQDGRNRKYR